MLEVPGQFDGAPAWSPNGREIAVASVELTAARRFASSVIDLFVPSEGIVVNSLASSRTAALIVDGWWTDGEGLLAWSDPRDSATLPAAGLPLVSYPLGDAPTATLPSTPAYPAFAVPDGAGVTLVTGGNRYPWSAKTITYCSDAGQCGPAPGALPAPVNLGPAASQWQGEPDLAFAHCASRDQADVGRRRAGAQRLVPDLQALVPGRRRGQRGPDHPGRERASPPRPGPPPTATSSTSAATRSG